MRLVDLNPHYITMPVRKENWTHERTDQGPDGAGGISFDCPECARDPKNDEWYHNSNGKMHHVLNLYVPEAFDKDPKIGPGRWNLVGTSFEDLSLVAGSSSVACRYGCRAHFFVKNGSITFCGDSGKGKWRAP